MKGVRGNTNDFRGKSRPQDERTIHDRRGDSSGMRVSIDREQARLHLT